MTTARRPSLAALVLLIGVTSTPIRAVSPSAVMVYGGVLDQPALLRPAGPSEFEAFGLLWWKAGAFAHPSRTVRGDAALVSALKARPYLNLAIFWGRYEPGEFEPGNASQHGRLYLPTASEPALVLSTIPDMQKRANPVPDDVEGFVAVWTLDSADIAALRSLGVPGLQPRSQSRREREGS